MADRKAYKRLNSKIPVLSKEYRKTIAESRKKQENLEKATAEVEVLKKSLKELSLGENSPAALTFELETPSSTRSPYFKSSIRSVIVTPKGTKRKGKNYD